LIYIRLAAGLQLRPHHVLGNPFPSSEGAEAAIATCYHAFAVADRPSRCLDALRHDFWVLNEIALAIDHARQQDHVVGKPVAAQGRRLVLATRIGEFDAQAPNIGLIEHREQQVERDVVDVRAFPVAPADMQADAVARGCPPMPC
jgi:hypothetical protein